MTDPHDVEFEPDDELDDDEAWIDVEHLAALEHRVRELRVDIDLDPDFLEDLLPVSARPYLAKPGWRALMTERFDLVADRLADDVYRVTYCAADEVVLAIACTNEDGSRDEQLTDVREALVQDFDVDLLWIQSADGIADAPEYVVAAGGGDHLQPLHWFDPYPGEL